MNRDEKLVYIADHMTEAALLDGLIEECAELQQGCSKMTRAIRGENPTTVTHETAAQWIAEEMTDVLIYIALIGIKGILPEDSEGRKIDRWIERLNGNMSA